MEPICKLKDVYKALYLFEKQFAEQNGITINEGMVLCCLKDGNAKAAGEICEFVGLSNSRVSRVITSVEAKGLISRKLGQKDKRKMIFCLTETGKAKITEMLSKEMNFSGLAEQLSSLLQ